MCRWQCYKKFSSLCFLPTDSQALKRHISSFLSIARTSPQKKTIELTERNRNPCTQDHFFLPITKYSTLLQINYFLPFCHMINICSLTKSNSILSLCFPSVSRLNTILNQKGKKQDTTLDLNFLCIFFYSQATIRNHTYC